MNAPEGFVPYKFDTGMGILTLPDRRCTMCIASNQYMACTLCAYKETLWPNAIAEARRYSDEIYGSMNKEVP